MKLTMKLSEHKPFLIYLFIEILTITALILTGYSKTISFSVPLGFAVITAFFMYFNGRRKVDDKLVKFSNIKMTEQDILQIEKKEKDDDLQELIDNIFKSLNSEELSLFRNLVKILDSKWSIIMGGFNKKSNTPFISSYFGEHYRKILYKLIQRRADYDYYYPVLNSFDSNINKFLLSKKVLKESTYLYDVSYLTNIFSNIIEKSIGESNNSVLGTAIEMLIEQMKSSIKLEMDDFTTSRIYIRDFSSIVEKACRTQFEIDFISVRLSWIGNYLASCEYLESLMQLLNIFDKLIDYEIKWNDKDNLIITERSLMYIWVHCTSSKTISHTDKIVSILKKIDVQSHDITLAIAYDKTQELLRSGLSNSSEEKEKIKYKENIENLSKIVEKLDILRRLNQKLEVNPKKCTTS